MWAVAGSVGWQKIDMNKDKLNKNGYSVQILSDLKIKPVLGLIRFNPQVRTCFVGNDEFD